MDKKIELSDSEKTLILATSKDLIPMLAEAKDLIHVRQSAFDYFDKETEEHFQVQIMVTRSPSDFLEFLETEEMRLANLEDF